MVCGDTMLVMVPFERMEVDKYLSGDGIQQRDDAGEIVG